MNTKKLGMNVFEVIFFLDFFNVDDRQKVHAFF